MKYKLITLLLCFGLGALNASAQIITVSNLSEILIKRGFSASDVNELVITNQYTSPHNGVTHVYFRQKVKGIELFNAVGNAHFKQGKLLSFHQNFVKDVAEKVQTDKPGIDAMMAIQNTANYLQVKAPVSLSKTATALVNNKVQIIDAVSSEPIKVQLYYWVDNGQVKLVYNTTWFDDATGNWWNVRVDAITGEVVDKNNWTTQCANHLHHMLTTNTIKTSAKTQTSGMLHKKAGAAGTYNALPLGVESPIHGNRVRLVNPSDSLASPWGWHDTNGVDGAEYTITRGNNVYASEDKNNRNQPGYSPNGGDTLVFDFPYDMTNGTISGNLDAAITNLFVWNNYIHDVMYHYGFDELSGNFQANNYGRGGEGDDYVFAEAQDGSGTNNANFATPDDGQNPRMQMYLWSNGPFPANYVTASDSTKTDSSVFVVANFGPKIFTLNNIHLKLVTGTNTLGCEALTSDFTGKAVLIDRGTCNYAIKVRNAQNAGAVLVIVANTGTQAPFAMTGSGASDITIPSVMISKAAGDALKARMLADSVTVSLNTNRDLTGLYDSDMDAGVITHEYGHGISNRLTGGPANSDCLTNAEQAGEGWSDFFTLVLTHRSGDNPEVGRGIGTWLSYQATTGLGIRNYRYSRSMTVNPSTYNSIKSLSVPHGVGSVWCTMLYDLYWNLIDKYGYDSNFYTGNGGNNRCLQLVMDGLKLQPCNPGFVDARNAILEADRINNGGADSALIWSTFARRGLGYSATQGNTTSRSDGVEAYDLPPVQTTGLTESNKESGMALWPNPNNGSFELMLPLGATEVEVSVMDITGKTVYTDVLQGQERVSVKVGQVQPGVYILKANAKSKVFSTKLVITN